jgi:hypothetical protein
MAAISPRIGIFGGPMEHREERIVVETSRYRITGTLRMPRDGYRSRLTDYLNAAERTFIALTDVEIESLDGITSPGARAYIAVSVAQIVLAMPLDAPGDEQ